VKQRPRRPDGASIRPRSAGFVASGWLFFRAPTKAATKSGIARSRSAIFQSRSASRAVMPPMPFSGRQGCRNVPAVPQRRDSILLPAMQVPSCCGKRCRRLHTPFATSRSLNFCSFPVLVFGISANTT
jgi:hypothetical protein